MVLVTFGLFGALWISFYVFCWIKFRWAAKMPTVEPMAPFFGNGLEFARKNSYDIFVSLTRAFQHNKRLFKLCFGPIPIVCTSHPDIIQKVLTDPASMDKPFPYEFMRVNQGLLVAKYESWKNHRKVLNPTFNTRILNSFIPIFNDCVNTMIQSVKEHHQPGKPLNILEFTSPCTLAMICRTSLGGKVLEREGNQQFVKGLEIILHNVGLRMFNANLYPNWVYRYTRFYRAEMKARKFCHGFTDKIIEEKQAYFAKLKKKPADTNNNPNAQNGAEDDDDEMTYKKPQIFIDQILTIPLPDGTPFSHSEVTDHIYTMIAAGNETSATQAAHTALLLAMHPEIQEKVVAELKEVFPTEDMEFCPDKMKQLVYLERVVKESQRLCPVAAIYGRKTLADLQLDEFVIPKGNIFILNIYALHRRKEFWGEDAELFVPDRFLPENSKNRHPFAYLPFSSGTRSCIGSRYAMMSLKTMVGELVRNYKLTTDIKYEEMEFKFKVSMHLACDHRLYLEPRNLYGKP